MADSFMMRMGALEQQGTSYEKEIVATLSQQLRWPHFVAVLHAALAGRTSLVLYTKPSYYRVRNGVRIAR